MAHEKVAELQIGVVAGFNDGGVMFGQKLANRGHQAHLVGAINDQAIGLLHVFQSLYEVWRC